MQWLTADIVFDGYKFHSNLYLQVDASGEIVQLKDSTPNEAYKKHNGLLMPGMINAHCHLELSHTKGLIEEKTGLSTFLQNVSKKMLQKVEDTLIQKAQQVADAQMCKNGIVAVGDICNTTKSIEVKQASKIKYFNFIECIAIRETDSVKRFADYKKVFDEFRKAALPASLVLHTPYTCNEGMYKLVNEHSNFISIHNQESEAENLLFERKEGSFDAFYEYFGLDKNEIIQKKSCKSSFENSKRLLSAGSKKLFVHNTFTRKDDFTFIDKNDWFCFCPKANLYIEDQLPDILLFTHIQERLVLGTDSLASNDSLNILAEAKSIQDNFPDIPLNKILQWATSNGAKLFGLEDTLGSFEVGKSPSFVVVEDFDLKNERLLGTDVLVV